jgi:2-polyprenyl-3-methyl-5-hydroxy-6-metoxy-1,4-benzoquinol methylase
MQEYQAKIYEIWGKKHPFSFSPPDETTIKQLGDFYGDFIIKKTFSQNKEIKILDIGCGYGVFLNECKILGYKNIFGVDVIGECVAFVKDKFGISTVVKSDIVSYLQSEADESFDVISAMDVIEHFKKEEMVDLLKLINQKLKKGGMFIMKVPNAGSMSGLYLFYSDLTHETAFTTFLVKEVFSMADFLKIKIMAEYNPKNIKSSFLYFVQVFVSKFWRSLKDRHIFSSNIIAIGYK